MLEAKQSASHAPRRLWRRIAAPIILLVMVTIAGAFAIFWDLAQKRDDAFVRESQALVQAAIDGSARAIDNTTRDFSFWNHAYRAITLKWDDAWVEENFFSAAVDGIVVFRADRTVRYSWFADPATGADMARIIARAAAATSELQAVARNTAADDMVIIRYAQAGGRLIIIATAPVSWETEALRRSDRRAHPTDYFASVDVLDAAELGRIGAGLGLGPLQFTPRPADADDSRTQVSLPVHDGSGATIGRLTWANQHPGTRSFAGQVWPIMFGLAVIGLMTFLVARHLVANQLAVSAQAEAALEASRLKSDFLATMSHELRTPLNAIIGYAEMIEELSDGGADGEESIPQDAARIRAAAGHLLNLISEILDHARIEAGRAPLDIAVVDVGEVMNEAAGFVARLAKANGNTLTLSVDGAVAAMRADRTRASQCLLNLLGNAAKFTKNGTIRMHARPAVHRGLPYVRIDVIDTGIGIDEAAQQKLFTPFSQADASITRAYGGAGLGLCITRNLANAMNGDVSVQSAPGKGSTFSLLIPAAEAVPLNHAA